VSVVSAALWKIYFKNIMKTMHAVPMTAYGDVSTLEYQEDYPIPEITSKQVLVKLSHASVNPVDYKLRKGALRPFLPSKIPYILGRDGCGVVSEIGSGVTKFKPGDEVMGLFSGNGGYAQYTVCEENDLCIKPKELDAQHAAAVPLIGLTVYQMYQQAPAFAKALKDNTTGTLTNKRILVIGASGGCGSIGVILGKHFFGSQVYAVCSGKNAEYVRSLGADRVIDYTVEKFVDVIPEEEKRRGNESAPFVDLILDCAGGDTNKSDADQIMDSTGSFVTIAVSSSIEKNGMSFRNVTGLLGSIMWSKTKYMVGSGPAFVTVLAKCDGEALGHLAQFLVSKNLTESIRIDKEFPLKELQEAHTMAETGRTVGKIIINIPE
jgi:NADPH:quinone reductase-like Zn-dependent oxidoreductase